MSHLQGRVDLLGNTCFPRAVPAAGRTLELELKGGRQVIEVEIAVPRPGADKGATGGGDDAGTTSENEWYLPLSYLSKDPVAPELEVRDAKGTLPRFNQTREYGPDPAGR